MSRVNLKPFKRFWRIAKLYWFGEEKTGAIAILILLLLLLIGYTLLSVKLTAQQGEVISSLSAKSEERFWQAILIFFGILVAYVPVFAGYRYIQDRLGNYWRRWLTNHFLDRYFTKRTYYQLGNFNTDIDNPDQRIAEDVKGFTQDSLRFFLVILNSVFQVIAFSAVLWNISRTLVIFLVCYAIAGTLITTGIFGKKLVNINFEQLKKEANFRFGLVRVRENSESIAFYQGEEREVNELKREFQEVFENFNKLILWQELLLGLFTYTYSFLPYVIPAIIVAPKVLSGEFEVGKVTEAQIAFSRVFDSLNLIVDRFQSLTAFVAGIDRIDALYQYTDNPQLDNNGKITQRPTIDLVKQPRLAAKHLTLQTPNYQQVLFKDLSFKLEPGQGLLVMGASGCGKSSLLRAIAGLWSSGTGAVVRPALGEILFLPQRPYMILGSLRDQLLYPHGDPDIPDEILLEILDKVNLPDLAERFGGLNAVKDWSEVLSLGEQQRLAFARILINRPRYVILDEATSALDIKNEENLYQNLKNGQITYISVGHRPTLLKYHDLLLEMIEAGKWQIKPIEQNQLSN